MIPAVVAGGATTVLGRCGCRPDCLSPVYPSDVTVVTAEGVALAVHAVAGYPGEQLPFPVPRVEPVAGVR